MHLPHFEYEDIDPIETDNNRGHFKLAVGGGFKVADHQSGIGGAAPLLPTAL